MELNAGVRGQWSKTPRRGEGYKSLSLQYVMVTCMAMAIEGG